jgi:hypothetical protein
MGGDLAGMFSAPRNACPWWKTILVTITLYVDIICEQYVF